MSDKFNDFVKLIIIMWIHNYSQEYIAKILGVTQKTVSKWINNISFPNGKTYIKIEKFVKDYYQKLSKGEKLWLLRKD